IIICSPLTSNFINDSYLNSKLGSSQLVQEMDLYQNNFLKHLKNKNKVLKNIGSVSRVEDKGITIEK
ncbi:MAG: hypothetical protein ACLR0A_19050, partial [Faecalibacillus intestinalis]